MTDLDLIPVSSLRWDVRTPDGTIVSRHITRGEALATLDGTTLYRCGARELPGPRNPQGGCQVLTNHQTECGAYRCGKHADSHEALCQGRRAAQ